MGFQEKQLAQQEATTSAASMYSPTSGTSVVKQVVVCNHEATASTYSIWVDDDGTTYSDATVQFEDVPIDGNSTEIIDVFWPMNDTDGNLAIDAGDASTITITLYGAEIT